MAIKYQDMGGCERIIWPKWGGGSEYKQIFETVSPKSTLLADNTQGLRTTNKQSPGQSLLQHRIPSPLTTKKQAKSHPPPLSPNSSSQNRRRLDLRVKIVDYLGDTKNEEKAVDNLGNYFVPIISFVISSTFPQDSIIWVIIIMNSNLGVINNNNIEFKSGDNLNELKAVKNLWSGGN